MAQLAGDRLSNMSTLLTLANISKRFGPTVALDGVNFDLRPGEVHALVGENGAGKSTLMNVLAGSLEPDQGSMELGGRAYHPANTHDARTKGVALIHQELCLCEHLSVAENILMGMEPSQWGWMDRRELEARTREVLKIFHHTDTSPEKRVADLSLPARQIVEISRAIAAKARVILMDEPTSSLQREDVEGLFALIRKLRAEGISIIYISHFLEEVRAIADRFTVLRDGRSVATGAIAEVTDEQLVGHMVGRSVENLFPDRPSQAIAGSEKVMEVKDLVSPPLLRHASFSLHRGEILGIAGLMGSGRTQLVRAIFGLDKPTGGTVTIKGKATTARGGTPAKRLFQRLGYLSEDRKGEGLALNLPIADNVTMTRFSACARGGWLNLSGQRSLTNRLIAGLGIKARDAQQPVKTLSGGNQQKVAVARLLHQDADVLLLDEPTRGIDIGSKVQVYETVARCAAENRSVLMISSYLPELFGMCDRLAVMSRGRLGEARPISEWTPESVMQVAIAGPSS
jgi:ribose transport system ATP-binding protein